MLNKDKEENRRRYYQKQKKKQVIIAITKKKFGSAKNYWCVLCEPKQSAIQWHHYTKPYETDKAISLCKFHHSNIHFGG